MDELMPKATGRDAMIEKRKFMNQQRREREISPGTVCDHVITYMALVLYKSSRISILTSQINGLCTLCTCK